MAPTTASSEKALWERSNRHLVRYGHYFQPVIIDRAQGAYMTTTDGRRLLDFASGQMSTILGHSHPEITAVIREQAGIHAQQGEIGAPALDKIIEWARDFDMQQVRDYYAEQDAQQSS